MNILKFEKSIEFELDSLNEAFYSKLNLERKITLD